MPRIEIDPTINDPIIIAIGDIELKVKDDFMIEDQRKFTEIEKNFDNPNITKEQSMLLFGLTEKEFDEIAKKLNFRMIKNALMEGYAAVSGYADMEKKTQEQKSLRSLSHSPDSSITTKSSESKPTMKKE
jgi:hypothetical protein